MAFGNATYSLIGYCYMTFQTLLNLSDWLGLALILICSRNSLDRF